MEDRRNRSVERKRRENPPPVYPPHETLPGPKLEITNIRASITAAPFEKESSMEGLQCGKDIRPGKSSFEFGRKRRAEEELENDQRLAKRFNLLNLGI